LKEGGYPRLQDHVSYYLTTCSTREPIAVLTQANLKKIGIDIEIEKVPGADCTTRLNKNDRPLLDHDFKAGFNYPDYYFTGL